MVVCGILTVQHLQFNDSGAEVDGDCVFVRPRSVSSGNAANLIVEGWPAFPSIRFASSIASVRTSRR